MSSMGIVEKSEPLSDEHRLMEDIKPDTVSITIIQVRFTVYHHGLLVSNYEF